ncbi:Tudor domain, partial [Trinorchestia longiramus]
KDTSMRLDRPYRVYLCGGLPLPTVDIVVNKTTMAKSLNRSVLQVLEKSGSVSLATRLQAYMWPVVSRGQNVIAVGERSGGKTTGYIFPLASLLLDMWPCVQQEASVRIGSVAIIICNGWRAVQRVGNEFSRLLAPHKIRVVTAWSGSGSNSLNEIQKEIYRGCDVLVSTLPFLMHLAGIQREEDAETRIQFDLLSYCFHLVFDDADVLLDSRAEDVKIVLREWAVSRSKNQTSHFCQQLIITASSWTKYICELAEFLFPLMEPTLMISSQLEAAKAAGVRSVVNITHCSDDSSQQKILGDVTELVIDGTSEKRIIIFVRHYSDARQLKKLLESRCVFSRVAHGRLHTWQLQEEVKAWRSADAGKILIVSDRVVPLLLQHDIRDAYIIVHTYVPNTKAEFTQRFSFLLDNYSEPFKSSHTAALDAPVCFVMLDDSSSLLPPYLLECLEYLNTDIPLEVKKKFAKCENRDIPLCHYLKAYGSCPSVNLCVWRHKIIEKDLLCQLPQSGIVTVDIVKVLNASRYLVRLNQFRIKVDCAFVDLSENYFTLFMTLQSFCSDESRLTKFVKPGREDNLCLVNYESVWARARILKHRQLPNMVRVPLFLIDEGTEIVVDVSELYELPLEFSNLPQLIVEVYLCKVRPLDDIDWTQNANVFVETIFNEARGGSQFTGTIATSLSHTLWLSPLVEIVKVEGSLIRKESIRSQLIRHEYGAANEEHLDLLERQLQVVKARQNSRTASWLDHWTPNKSKESSE